MLFKKLRQLVADRGLDDAFDFTRDEFRFCLRVERRIGVLDAEYARQAFACVFALKSALEVAKEILVRAVGVDALR